MVGLVPRENPYDTLTSRLSRRDAHSNVIVEWQEWMKPIDSLLLYIDLAERKRGISRCFSLCKAIHGVGLGGASPGLSARCKAQVAALFSATHPSGSGEGNQR